MNCNLCNKKSIIELQHGSLCEMHFLRYFEEKVFKTIKKYRLIDRNDKICVATSGGKDSTAALYLTKRYFEKYKLPLKNLFALAIDEGIKRHRNESLKNLKKFCKDQKIELKVVNVKDEFKTTIDRSVEKIRKQGKKPCTVCGIWRRYLLNKASRENGANRLITGHNLDDEAQAILMNQFKANVSLAASLGPISGLKDHELFVRRIKPLYFCTNKEVEVYTTIKQFELDYCGCLYSQEGYRSQIKKMLNDFEKKYPGTKQGIVKSFLDLLPLIKERAQKTVGEIKICEECGEPANQNVCNACKLKGQLV
jgi:tRNA-5-methyluridine54 2-sulfurtransferase